MAPRRALLGAVLAVLLLVPAAAAAAPAPETHDGPDDRADHDRTA